MRAWLDGRARGVAVLVIGTVVFWAGDARASDPLVSDSGVTSDPPTSAFEVAEQLQDAFAAVADQVSPAVVTIEVELDPEAVGDRDAAQARVGYGTGFIISEDGVVLTNSHVITPARRLTVILEDRRELPARVVGHDPTTDVAVLQVDVSGLPAAPLGDDAGARVGDWVLSIGNPYGLERTVTQGIISATGRTQVGASRGAHAVRDFIQTDAPMNVGSSGGPLVDIRGQVIGLNARIASGSGAGEGYGFAVPITLVREVVDEVLEHGRVRRPHLGVLMAEVRQGHAEAAGLERAGIGQIRGALVAEVADEAGPAARAGLETGDVIVGVGDRQITTVAELQRVVRTAGPDAVMEIEFVRGGDLLEVSVRLGVVTDEGVAGEDRAIASGLRLL